MSGHWSHAATAFIAVGTRRLRQANKRCAPRHLMRPVLSAGRRCQTARLSNLSSNNALVPCGGLCQESFPSMLRTRRSPASRRGKIALAANIRSFKYYIYMLSLGPHVGARSLCACPPSAIKGDARAARPSARQTLSSSYKLPSNTSHSGVGYYAPATRTTLNPRVLSCVDPPVS
jgi:hypothetical protein